MEAKEDYPAELEPFGFKFIVERWSDSLKLIGGANGAGLVFIGVALERLTAGSWSRFLAKGSGLFFLLGVALFVYAYFCFSISWFALDTHLIEIKEAVQAGDSEKIAASARSSGQLSSSSMNVASPYVLAAIICFMCGLISGSIALLCT